MVESQSTIAGLQPVYGSTMICCMPQFESVQIVVVFFSAAEIQEIHGFSSICVAGFPSFPETLDLPFDLENPPFICIQFSG